MTLQSSRIVPPAPPGWTWERLMLLALEDARAAARDKEIPVGALVVSGDGEILGLAGNRAEALTDSTAHAEILAIRQACQRQNNYRLEGSVLVATLEPCLMCAGALVHARIAGLVYGAADAKAGAISSCMEALDAPFLNHRPWHMGGVCHEECTALLRRFFEERR